MLVGARWREGAGRGAALPPPKARPRASGARGSVSPRRVSTGGEGGRAGAPHRRGGLLATAPVRIRAEQPTAGPWPGPGAAPGAGGAAAASRRGSGTAPLRFLLPPGRGRPYPAGEASLSACRGAQQPPGGVTGPRPAGERAGSPPHRTKGPAEARKRPGATGRAAPPARGANPHPGGPAWPAGRACGRRCLSARLSPPRRALQRARREEGGKWGNRGRRTQCNSSGDAEGGLHNEAGGSPCPFR